LILKRLFSSRLKNIVIYFLVTFLPSLVISYDLAQHKTDNEEIEYKRTAQRYANFHAMNIENFIGETVGRLEMLATSIKMHHHNLDDVEKILIETQENDPRFSGFYWANTEGDLLISSNPTSSLVNVGDREYFQQALITKNTSISEAHIGRVTGRYIITIASPVKENAKVHGVLLASLRIDEMKESITNLLEEEMITLTDNEKRVLVEAGYISNKEKLISARMRISVVPWTITSYVIPDHSNMFRNSFLLLFVEIFTLANILFLLIMYFLLRKKVKNEKAQIERQKLELVGNLATSTAHEIRNPLTGIKGLVKLMGEEYQDSKAQYYVKVIQTEIDRINAIVSELLVLGKPTAHTLMTYNANEILAEIEPIIESEAKFMNVDLTLNYYKEMLSVSCVKDHLKQVILNLTKNALQAMPEGGKLNISLEKVANDCIIQVEDNGIGLSQDSIGQVFNPFFSTKKDGSGLGLTVCKRIIDSFDGDISINSTLHQGTTVEIRLPVVK
jgi:two-component system, sporulation sensor kinase D